MSTKQNSFIRLIYFYKAIPWTDTYLKIETSKINLNS